MQKVYAAGGEVCGKIPSGLPGGIDEFPGGGLLGGGFPWVRAPGDGTQWEPSVKKLIKCD